VPGICPAPRRRLEDCRFSLRHICWSQIGQQGGTRSGPSLQPHSGFAGRPACRSAFAAALQSNRDGVDFRRPVREQSACTVSGEHRWTVTAETGLALVGQRLGSRGPSCARQLMTGGNSDCLESLRHRRDHGAPIGFRAESLRVSVPESGSERANFTLSVAIQDLDPVLVRGQRIKYTAGSRATTSASRGERRVCSSPVSRSRNEHPRNLTQLLQRVPGVSLQRLGGASMGIRLRDRTCWPLVWLDGHALPSGEADLDGILRIRSRE